MPKKESSSFALSLQKQVGKEISKYRKRKKMTQAILSHNISISTDTLINYEKGKVVIPFDKLVLLCMALGISTFHLQIDRFHSLNENGINFETKDATIEAFKKILEHSSDDERGLLLCHMINEVLRFEPSSHARELLTCYANYTKDERDLFYNANIQMSPKAPQRELTLEEILTPPERQQLDYQQCTVKVQASK